MGGLHGLGLRRRRLLYKEVVEVWLNYNKSCFWWFGNLACGEPTGSNRIEKDQGRVSARLVWGKTGENGQCDLVRAECLQMIRLMVVMLMSYSRVVNVVLFLGVAGPILRNGYETEGQKMGGSETSAGWRSKNLILGIHSRWLASFSHICALMVSAADFNRWGPSSIPGEDRTYTSLSTFC